MKGLTEAVDIVFPKTTVKTGIVHLIRNSLDYAGLKDRNVVARAQARSELSVQGC